MSKVLLKQELLNISECNYTWELFFYNMFKQNHTIQYTGCKIPFKHEKTLTDYASKLCFCINKYQLEHVEEVEEYTGYNPKISCDKISIHNEIISESYSKFVNSLFNFQDSKIEDKYTGYALLGKKINEDGNQSTILFVKQANPITKLNTKRNAYFRNIDNVLDYLTDDVYRLYYKADCIIFQENIYALTQSFEAIFNLEKSTNKLKDNKVGELTAVQNISANEEEFKQALNGISSRTFITYSEERLNTISTSEGRREVSRKVGLPVNEEGSFLIHDKNDAKKLMNYLCQKLFYEIDDESSLYVCNNATKLV